MFLSALLAATILPLGSEAVLLALLYADYPMLPLLIVATTGNVAGSWINYWIGRHWGRPGIKRFLKVTDDSLIRAEQHFRTWGRWSLCLAWVPVIGDPLTLIAGLIRVHPGWFLFLVTIGKAARYIAISLLA